jgi:hypothetical protein
MIRHSFQYRGVMFDVSRGKIPKIETVQTQLERLKDHGLNTVMLYIESVVKSKAFAPVYCGKTPITFSYLRQLNHFCAQQQIHLVPILQSFGHQEHLLAHPKFQKLAEMTYPKGKDGTNNFTPASPEVYDRLEQWFGEIMPLCNSPWLHVGCDEVSLLGKGRTGNLVKHKGYARVFADHILRLHGIAKKMKKPLMMWADMLIHYPEIADMLPKDIIMMNWGYEPRDSVFEEENLAFKAHSWLAKKGFTTWVAGGAGCNSGIFPNFERIEKNSRTWIEEAAQASSEGFLVTDWGDAGHKSTAGSVFLGFAYGLDAASKGWKPIKRFLPEFAEKYFSTSETRSAATEALSILGTAERKHFKKIGHFAGSKSVNYDSPLGAFLTDDFRTPVSWSHRMGALAEEDFESFKKEVERALKLLQFQPSNGRFGVRLLDEYQNIARRFLVALNRGELWYHWIWRSGSPYDTPENLRNRKRLELYLKTAEKDASWWESVWRKDNLETELPRFLKEMKAAQAIMRDIIP